LLVPPSDPETDNGMQIKLNHTDRDRPTDRPTRLELGRERMHEAKLRKTK
jgi:hypothetical protein